MQPKYYDYDTLWASAKEATLSLILSAHSNPNKSIFQKWLTLIYSYIQRRLRMLKFSIITLWDYLGF
jgi:hypothetical protein